MLKALKKHLKYQNLFKNPASAENSHLAEISQPTCNANKLTGSNILRAQNKKKLQNRPEYQ